MILVVAEWEELGLELGVTFGDRDSAMLVVQLLASGLDPGDVLDLVEFPGWPS